MSELICNSCDQPKANLECKKSKISGMNLFLCATCIKEGYEPRHILIIGYYSGGVIREKATEFIKKGLYLGAPITLVEVL
jgi:hypothetical protein